MKQTFFTTIIISFLLVLAGCQKKDIRELRSELDKQKDLIAQLQKVIGSINTDIKSLQAITTALQNKVSVNSYTATGTGYLLTMSDGSTIELKNGINGTNGKDGADAPRIGIKQDADGAYYWTLANDWLLQNGQKLRVTGKDGSNGTNGTNGITPLLKVDNENNFWLISYDNGSTWQIVQDKNGNPVVATGPKGETGSQGSQGTSGTPGFSITETADAIIIIYMGASYTLPKGNEQTNNNNVPNIVFATDKPLGQSIHLIVDADLADRSGVWIDRNNNEQRDDNETVGVFGNEGVNFTLTNSKTITIYGKVKKITLSNQSITELNVSGNTLLAYLDCSNNKLLSLDVASNTLLTELFCDINHLTSLDIASNTLLTHLGCSNNKLLSLNVASNTLLNYLYCSNNSLKSLDITKNAALDSLACVGNELSTLNVTQNPRLTLLSCGDNELSTLNITQNPSLKYLRCYTNNLSALDLSNNSTLVELSCEYNKIKGEAMSDIINNLPTSTKAFANIYGEYLKISEGNSLPNDNDLQVAARKNWKLYRLDFRGYSFPLN